jgi:hypothetical protein
MKDVYEIRRRADGLWAIREAFTWESEDKSRSIRFDITTMLAAIAHGVLPYGKCETELDREFAREWLPLRDLDMDRLVALQTDPKLHEPCLGVRMIDDTVLLIDGSHRYMARYLLNLPDVLYHIIEYNDWQPYATVLKP